MTRIPYAERERVIEEFCTCTYVWRTREDGTPERRGIHNRDTECLIHGDNARWKEVPF